MICIDRADSRISRGIESSDSCNRLLYNGNRRFPVAVFCFYNSVFSVFEYYLIRNNCRSIDNHHKPVIDPRDIPRWQIDQPARSLKTDSIPDEWRQIAKNRGSSRDVGNDAGSTR